MGVTLERVQFKFASIIGELCSEPRVLSQFAVWLDLRLAEYKLRGSISLECSNDKPDPTWLSGIKEEKLPEKVLPYMIAASKGRRKPPREPPYMNSAVPRHPQNTKTVVFPEIAPENTLYQRLDSRVHSAHIPDRVSSSPVMTSQKSGLAEVPVGTSADNRLSGNVPVKEEPKDNTPLFPLTRVGNERQSTSPAASTVSKCAPSTNRRKRQPSAIVRNSSALISSGNFTSPASSEDDPLPDSFFAPTLSKSSRISEGAVTQSSSDTVTDKDSDVPVVSKPDEFPVDSTTNSPMTSQAELVNQPPGGSDSQMSFSKGEDSTFTPPAAEDSGLVEESADARLEFECDTCGKAFADQYDLTVHALCHTEGNDAIMFFCENCDVSLSKEEALLHIEVSHVVEERKVQSQPLPCPFCTKVFLKKRYLREHLRIHAAKPERICPRCGERFVWRASLNNHLKKCNR